MRLPFLRALSQRDFALLWTGQTVSQVGDGMSGVALAWQALQFPSPSAVLGLVLVVRSISRVGTILVGGAFADRYPKRFLMLGGDVLQMVAIGALAYVIGNGSLQVWQLAVVAGASGIGSGIFLASSSAIVPELVSDEYFQSANSLRSSSMLLASDFVGPAVGGALVAAAGTATAFAVDAATFLASIAALWLIRPRHASEEGPRTTILADVKEGIGYVARTPWILISLFAVGTVGNFVSYGPLPVLIPLLVRNHLQGGADVLGFVWAGFGIGGLLGAVVMGSLRAPLSSAVPAYLGWGSSAVALGLLGFAPNAVVAAALLATAGFAGQMAEVIWVTLQQTLVPRRLLGRVTSTDWLLSLSLQPLGVGLAAPVAAAMGVTGALTLGAVISTSAMALGACSRAVRKLPPPPEADAGSEPSPVSRPLSTEMSGNVGERP